MADILKNRNFRREIVQRINKLIDLPFLNERQEAQLISIAVDMCFDALTGKKKTGTTNSRSMAVQEEEEEVGFDLPEEGDPKLDESARQKMIDDINKRVNIPGLSEDQEEVFIRAFVDALFKPRGEKLEENSQSFRLNDSS